MNLFWSTRALTDAREDHLTEFIAASLLVSESFRHGFYDLVIAGYAQQNGWEYAEIKDVRTQIGFENTTCCPDMVLHLSNGKKVVCEHKLDALETLGPVRDQRGQLERYLDLPVDGVAYIRSAWNPPAEKVLEHPRYIRPANREHFMWRDFYQLLQGDNHVLIGWLREGFERLGFTPPHPSIGEMTGPDTRIVQENRRNFEKFWGNSRGLARSLGWKVQSGSIVELYLSDNERSPVSDIFISPAKFNRFLFRVTPRGGKLKQVSESLHAAVTSIDATVSITEREVKRTNGKAVVIDVVTSLREILGDSPLLPEEIEERLYSFLGPLLHCLKT